MKRFNSFILALLIAATSLTITSCDKSEKEYQKYITEADGFFNQKMYDDALKIYKKAAKVKPEEKYPGKKISEIKKIIAEQKAEENYYLEIGQADKFFDNEEYESALAAYTRALSYKNDEQYPKDKIDEIDLLLAELSADPVENTSYTYHIVVGSYEIESNAEKMQQKLKDEGFDARLVSRFDGEFTAVILASYPNIHDAYNNLTDAKAHAEHPWVIYKKF